MTDAGQGGRWPSTRPAPGGAQAAVVAVLRLGASIVGPIPTAVVTSAVITTASVCWWARVVEPRLFTPRRRPANRMHAEVVSDAERHLAVAEALAAVSLSSSTTAGSRPRPSQSEQRAIVTTERPLSSGSPAPDSLNGRRRNGETLRPSNGGVDHASTEEPSTDPADAEAARRSVATVLVEIAHERYRFGVSTEGDVFAVPKDGPRVVSLLHGGRKSLRAELAREYFARTRRTAPQQALADALLVIEGTAQDSDERTLYMRVARHQDALWLDLGDHSGAAVSITPSGWAVEAEAPVLFRRTALTSPLPVPVAAASSASCGGGSTSSPTTAHCSPPG